jgi:hypothetical protein
MLFDIRGKRKRVVQVVYAALAVLFLVGFVGFGVGVGNGPGGIFDALGLGGGGSGSTSSAFAQQISSAEARVKKDPKDENALLNLAKYRYLRGQTELGQASTTTGAPEVTDTSRADFVQAVDYWNRYLKLAQKPDPIVAGYIAQGYAYLNDATGAAKAQELFAKAKPSANTYGTLALYLYANGDIKGGDAAAAKAVTAAPGASRKQIQKQLEQLGKQARKYKQAQATAAKAGAANGTQGTGGQALQSPFGGLAPSGSTGTTP